MKAPALILAGALVAGCNLAPHYAVPPAGTPQAYKEGGAPLRPEDGWKVAEPGDDQLRGTWWEVYNDPELDALETKVASANQSVISAEATFRQARALVTEARAGLYPSLNAAPSVTRSRSSAGVSSSGNGSTGSTSSGSTTSSAPPGTTRTTYDLPIDASYEVDLWGSVRNSISQNAALAQASAADYASELLSMQAEVAQDYFQLRSVDEQRRILDTTLDDYRASLKLTDTLFRSGLVTQEDIAEAETQLETAQAQATDLGVSRATYEHAIAVLIGVSPAGFSLEVRPFDPKIPIVPLAVPSKLLERRPDVAGAERRMAAANAEIGIARAAFFPTLSLSASAGFEATSLSHLLDWPNRFWSVGPAVSQVLFDGGLRKAETERARAAFDQTVADYRQTVLAAFQSVEDELSTLRILAQEESEQHAAVAAAEQTVKLSVNRYEQGLDSYLNVITAQNTFLTNRVGELQVQLRQLVASIGLIKNLGGGWSFSDWRQIERDADQGARATEPTSQLAPADTQRTVANPPPLPPAPKKPEEMLNQDQTQAQPATPPRN